MNATSEPFDVKEFTESGLLWAANHFVLWPLGVALAVTIRSPYSDDRASDDANWVAAGGKVEDPPGTYLQSLTLMQWAYPDGHRETIESESQFEWPVGTHIDRWEAFKAFVAARVELMPLEEREAASHRLASLGIGVTMQGKAFVVGPRPRWQWASPVEVGPVDAGDE